MNVFLLRKSWQAETKGAFCQPRKNGTTYSPNLERKAGE